MDEFLLFEAFERGDYIPQQHIKKVISYICGQLISLSPNRSYYQYNRQYNLATKLTGFSQKKRNNLWWRTFEFL